MPRDSVDTGLGKTIEAGLIARELLLRRKARTMVVAAPASVLEQWKAEMEERFGLLFVILDRMYLTRVRQERGFGVNPWRTYSRFLVSHNLLIDPTYADPMREWLGEMQPGGLLILDEAHHAAPSSGGRYGIETKFTRVIRDLGGRFEHRLFLSATPHNGHSNSFSTLLELLDPYRFTRGGTGPGQERARRRDGSAHQGGTFARSRVTFPSERCGASPSRTSRRMPGARSLAPSRRVPRLAGARSFASPPGADDERAEYSDDEREAEEAAQIDVINAVAESDFAGDAEVETIRRKEEALLVRMEEVASAARGLPDAKTRRLIDWIRDNLCPDILPAGDRRSASPDEPPAASPPR